MREKPERILLRAALWNALEIILLPILIPLELTRIAFRAARRFFSMMRQFVALFRRPRRHASRDLTEHRRRRPRLLSRRRSSRSAEQ